MNWLAITGFHISTANRHVQDVDNGVITLPCLLDCGLYTDLVKITSILVMEKWKTENTQMCLKKSHSIKKKEDKYVARNNDQRVKTEH